MKINYNQITITIYYTSTQQQNDYENKSVDVYGSTTSRPQTKPSHVDITNSYPVSSN